MSLSQEMIENVNQETLQTLEDAQSQSFFVHVIEFINYSSSEFQFNYDASSGSQSNYEFNLDQDSENGHSINSLNTYHPRVLKKKYQELLKFNESDDDKKELSSQEIESDSADDQFDNDSQTNAIQSIRNYQSNIQCLSNFTKKYKQDQQNLEPRQYNTID